MARSGVLAMAALACAVGLSAVGCAAGERPGPAGVVSADPRLAAAVDTIQNHAAKSRTFAGVVADPGNHTIDVYRLPDPTLDAQIRAEVQGVRIIFRDATYSLVQMTGLIHRIMGDREFWRTNGIKINGAAPEPNGSGVLVFVARNPDAAQPQLRRHYPAIRITAQREGAVLPTMGPVPAITVPGPLPSKSTRH